MSLDNQAGWIEHVSKRAALLHKHIQSPAIEPFRNKPWLLIDAVMEFAKQNDVPMLISRAKMEVIRNVLAEMHPKPKVILEFGAYIGSSAVAWGAILRDLHGPDAQGLRVYAFEFDPEIAQCARDLVEMSGLKDVVTIMQGTASDSVIRLHADKTVLPGQVDMAFIDHYEEYYVPDLQLCEDLKLFHKGSVVCADNTDYPGAPSYLKYVKAGGSGEQGAVKYESDSVVVAKEKNQSIVEVSRVIQA